MFVQLEDISHNEVSLQGQQLQYPEKLHHKATLAPACFLPPLHPPPFIFAHSFSDKCCSHLLQEYRGFDLGLCLLCYLAIKHTLPSKQET